MSARAKLLLIAAQSRNDAVDAFAKGVSLIERATQIEQLARMASSDETCLQIVHAIENGANPAQVNAKGGSS